MTREEGKDIQVNAEFQRIAERDKNVFIEQFKEVEENNGIGKTKDLFKIITHIKRIFHARMGTIKDRNRPNRGRRDHRSGGQNTQKNYTKKGIDDLGNHNGMITHLEPDILKCEVELALGSITTNKASRGQRQRMFQLCYNCSNFAC